MAPMTYRAFAKDVELPIIVSLARIQAHVSMRMSAEPRRRPTETSMNAPTPAPQTLFDKIWIEHHVLEREDGQSMLYVDSHFLDRRPLSKCCASAA
jgi:hypothetical protein